MKAPDFLIVGEAKCGTTSLYEDLIKHPHILPTKGFDKVSYDGGSIYLSQKEPRFFDRHWHLGLDWYLNKFTDEPGTITGDGSPMYFYRALSMYRIKLTFPDIKIIIMLRNPVDRLFSHFHHIAGIVPKWGERYPTFGRFIDCAFENDYHIIDRGIYANAMRNCLRLFKRGNIHIVKSESYFAGDSFEDVTDFLGVSEMNLKEVSHFRASGYESPMDPELRKVIGEFYRPFNEELYSLVGTDMGW